MLKVATVLVGLLASILGTLQAQQADKSTAIAVILDSKGIRPTLIDFPQQSGTFTDATNTAPTTEAYKGKKWLQVAFEFTAQNVAQGYIDEIKFKIFVEAKQFRDLTDKVGEPVVLTGETTLLNVPAVAGQQGTRNTGFFYIHPAVIDRFGGPDRCFRFLGVKKSANTGGAGNYNIRIEASIGGQPLMLDKDGVVPYADLLKDDADWVKSCQAVPNMVLGKDLTPWALAWLEYTPMIKPTPQGGN